MSKLSTEKRDEIVQLVTAQKKAKLSWVAIICQVAEDDLRENLDSLGLVIEGDFILIRSESIEQKTTELLQVKRDQLITEIVNKRCYDYNPNASIHVAVNSLGTSYFLGYTPKTLSKGRISEGFDNVYVVVQTFHQEFIVTSKSHAMKILEQMKSEIRKLPDNVLCLHIPIKRFVEFLLLTQRKDKDKTDIEQTLLTTAANEDVIIHNSAEKLFWANVVSQTKDGNILKEVIFRLPSAQVIKVMDNQFLQFFDQMVEFYKIAFRKQFYERDNLITMFIQTHS